MNRLEDRVALVTGASSGIGNAIAAAYGREGATVVVADIRKDPKLDDERSVFEELEEYEAETLYVETDVTDEAATRNAVEKTVAKFGQLDIVVNNAGIYSQYELHETPTEEWESMIDANLRGIFYTSKSAIPELEKSENGKIINLASIHGLVGAPKSAAYCASKGGVANLTRQMAVDYAADEINVNALAPGIIKTAQNVEWRRNNPEIVETWERRTPWPRFGEPQDVAPAAVFLASDESDFITGTVLRVDGGWLAQ